MIEASKANNQLGPFGISAAILMKTPRLYASAPGATAAKTRHTGQTPLGKHFVG
jgi:hypothetical protein